MTECAFNTIHVRAAAGRSTQLGQRLGQIAEAVRSAPGSLDYAVQRSQQDPDLWTVKGRWACAAQLLAHFELPALQDFIALTAEQLASRLHFDH